jgi:prepilin-type N-terminal cleavage/methylation domain-containing protein
MRFEKKEGFTMVEILIAMAVFVIGIVAVIGIFPKGIQMSIQSQDDSTAANFMLSFEATVKDAMRKNSQNDYASSSVTSPSSIADATNGYYVRFFFDGSDTSLGALCRLPWDNEGIPATTNNTITPDYTTLANSPDRVGWWWPNQAGYIPSAAPGGALYPTATAHTTDNDGKEVAQLGNPALIAGYLRPDLYKATFALGTAPALFATTPRGTRLGLEDPITHYSYQFRAEFNNRLTPYNNPIDTNGDGVIDAADSVIMEDPTIVQQVPVPAASTDFYPGMYRFTVYIFRDWNPAMTNGPTQNGIQQAREESKVHAFQFLVSGTQQF